MACLHSTPRSTLEHWVNLALVTASGFITQRRRGLRSFLLRPPNRCDELIFSEVVCTQLSPSPYITSVWLLSDAHNKTTLGDADTTSPCCLAFSLPLSLPTFSKRNAQSFKLRAVVPLASFNISDHPANPTRPPPMACYEMVQPLGFAQPRIVFLFLHFKEHLLNCSSFVSTVIL